MDTRIIYDIGVENFFRIINNIYDEITVYDNNYRVIYINESAVRHYGLTPDEIIGKNHFELINENKSYWSNSVIAQVYEKKEPVFVHQRTYLDVEIETIVIPLFDQQGKIEYVVYSSRDKYIGKNAMFFVPEGGGDDEYLANPIVAESSAMKKLLQTLTKLGKSDATCLLFGETGTGKSLLAQYAHEHSNRKNKPFLAVNCASIPSELIESELFGYTAGAFTGAKTAGRKGYFEQVNGGTIFLDEIGELSYTAQAKLLHVLHDKCFFPIGGDSPIQIDVRIITATNRNLKQMVKDGLFREDLYYRINTFELFIPPLRERTEDLRQLISFFMNTFCQKYGAFRELTSEALEALMKAPWYGNVRELSHKIESLVVMTDTRYITEKDLRWNSSIDPNANGVNKKHFVTSLEGISFDDEICQLERQLITDAYNICGSSRKVAKHLNISQTRASKLIRKYIPSIDTKE